jgi:uncharacterized Zn finger protein
VWTTTIPEDRNKWMQGECNCPAFFKKQICKHIVGIAIRLRYAIPPPEAKTFPIAICKQRNEKVEKRRKKQKGDITKINRKL